MLGGTGTRNSLGYYRGMSIGIKESVRHSGATWTMSFGWTGLQRGTAGVFRKCCAFALGEMVPPGQAVDVPLGSTGARACVDAGRAFPEPASWRELRVVAPVARPLARRCRARVGRVAPGDVGPGVAAVADDDAIDHGCAANAAAVSGGEVPRHGAVAQHTAVNPAVSRRPSGVNSSSGFGSRTRSFARNATMRCVSFL